MVRVPVSYNYAHCANCRLSLGIIKALVNTKDHVHSVIVMFIVGNNDMIIAATVVDGELTAGHAVNITIYDV